MERERWEKIQELFHRAAELPETERRAFLQAASGGDASLFDSVEAMLREDGNTGSMLQGPIGRIAHELIGASRGFIPAGNFGPYKPLKFLGEGGMGVIYLASREDFGSTVAIKILRDAWLSPARRERFASEQRTLAQLNHPGIARIYDADALSDGTPWFAMEYVEGVPLTEYSRIHRCSLIQRLQLLRAVCEAVQYAHEHAVIHRDLKPSNILVKGDGSIRLLDFGIAKQVEGLDAPVTETLTGLRLLTPAYASPEQVRGERVATQTDVYSLGVILYELLTGELPFNLSNAAPGEIAGIVSQSYVTKPSVRVRRNAAAKGVGGASISRQSWADLDVLCLTAMHKDPQRRYRSVDAFIRDIDHFLRGEPLDVQPDSLYYRASKFILRNVPAVAAACVVFVLIVGLVTFFTIRVTKARDAALEEAARTERIQTFLTNLFQGGDETSGPSDQLRVVTLLGKGVQEARALSNDPRLQSHLYETLGGIYEKLGRLEQAESLLVSARDERVAVFGPHSPEVAETLVALSQLRADQAKFDQAEQLSRAAIAIDKESLEPGHPASAKAMTELGMVLEDQGKYNDAIPVLQQAVDLESAPGGVKTNLSASLTELANCHYYLGHYDVAQSLNQRVLALDRTLYGEGHPEVANDLINLGAIQLDEGHYAEAEALDRQALDIIQSFYGKDNGETASAMTLLGRALVTDGKYSDAAGILQQALAIEQHVYGPVHPRIASTLNELGKVAEKQGRFADAKQDFRRMIAIYDRVYHGKHYYIGIALTNLASVYMQQKQYGEAARLIRQALQMYAKTLPPGHLNVGIARVRLGRALERQSRSAQAVKESQAGYDILQKQSHPPAAWLRQARADLIEEYTRLKEPQKAAKFRAELAENKQSAQAGKF
jgi:serine/threonine protein kinase/tetratricopeptide (TPR) repeat protein